MQYVIRILAAGKSVISEKPLAGSLAGAQESIQAHRTLQVSCLLSDAPGRA
jgi:predicted dehydrogenase